MLFVDTAPVLEILKTLDVEEFITFNILLVLPAEVCLIVNVELAPPLVTSSLSVVYTSVFKVVDIPWIIKLELTTKSPFIVESPL